MKAGLVKLAQQLIRVNTSNPPGNEKAAADILVKRLRALGLEVKIFEATRGRPNVLGIWKGRGNKTLILHGHLDTVPAGEGWRFDPFSGRVEAGKIYGRGATDMKGCLAAMISAISMLRRERWQPAGTLMFLACANEEMGDPEEIGLKYVAPRLAKLVTKPALSVLGDATDFEISIAEKGVLWLELVSKGKEAHGSMPWLGVNAVEKLAKVIPELRKLLLPIQHPLLGGSTISVNTISGGFKTNVIPDRARAAIDIRLVPGEDPKKVKALIAKLLARMKGDDPKINIEIKKLLYIAPVEIDMAQLGVAELVEAVRSVIHRKAKFRGSHGATGAGFLIKAGIPAIMCGPGKPELAHAKNEHIKIDDLVKAARIYAAFAKSFLA
jgi:succinyl-diaminopimelate desuccinylase